MTKSEFISKYGEERYREMVKKTLERYHAKPKVKKERKERAKAITNCVSTKVPLPCPNHYNYEEIDKYKWEKEVALQKLLRKKWKEINNGKPFILVVNAASRTDNARDFFNMDVSLNQLGMKEDDKNAFRTLVKNCIGEL